MDITGVWERHIMWSIQHEQIADTTAISQDTVPEKELQILPGTVGLEIHIDYQHRSFKIR